MARSEVNDKEAFAASPLFSKQVLRIVFLGAIACATLIFTLVLATPEILDSMSVRYMICLFLSFCLAIAFFVFWPSRLEMDRIPLINLPLRVTGPIALWLGIFSLLLATMPSSEKIGKVYKAVKDGSGYIFMYDRTTTLERRDGRPLSYQLIPNRDRLGELYGVFVEFEPGETKINARLTHHGHQPVDTIFERDKITFDVSSLEKIGETK